MFKCFMFAYFYANVHAVTQLLKVTFLTIILRYWLNYVYFRQRIQIKKMHVALHKLIIDRFFAWVE